jgi:DNA polymerase-1
VPGVEKCGPKTAVKWLTNTTARRRDRARRRDQGRGRREPARALDFLPLGRKLVTVETACDLAPHLESIEASLKTDGEARDLLRDIFARYGFKTWLREVDSAPPEAAAPTRATASRRRWSQPTSCASTRRSRPGRSSTRGSRRSMQPH